MSSSNLKGFECPSLISLSSRPKLFCSMLDKSLGPCLRSGHVIEVVGEAGSGKTQFGLHLSARVVVGDPDANAKDSSDKLKMNDKRTLYISTEGPFPIGRLRQMIEGMGQSKQLMDKIFIENISTNVSIKGTKVFSHARILIWQKPF